MGGQKLRSPYFCKGALKTQKYLSIPMSIEQKFKIDLFSRCYALAVRLQCLK
jgi:hypothetical protein